MSSRRPAVAPHGGRAPRVGTNPFAVGMPRQGQEPVIVDFATSRLAVGKIRVALNTGASLPDGVLIDGAGEPTNDPATHFATPKGAILPFGEHKGWALAFACETLAAALTGGTVQKGPKLRNAVVNCMLSILIDPQSVWARRQAISPRSRISSVGRRRRRPALSQACCCREIRSAGRRRRGSPTASPSTP